MDIRYSLSQSHSVTESYNKNLIKWGSHMRIDVPYGYEDVSVYRASLGHKANHRFDNNGEYEYYKSPRFGRVRCIQAKRDIKRGEEIFPHYGYKVDSDFTPRWYREAHAQHVRDNPDFCF